jgi:hypothetical protein
MLYLTIKPKEVAVAAGVARPCVPATSSNGRLFKNARNILECEFRSHRQKKADLVTFRIHVALRVSS